MAWRMLARRCPTRSMTVVGDVAQTAAAWGARSWEQMLEPVAPQRWTLRELTVNYRTPREVMDVAADVLAAVEPTLAPPSSVRDAGEPPLAHRVVPGDDVVTAAVALVADIRVGLGGGKLALVVPDTLHAAVAQLARERFGADAGTGAEGLDAAIAVLTVTDAKGLEFDAVVLVEPALWVAAGRLRDLYVALTRPTQRLDVVHSGPLPDMLARLTPAEAAVPGS